MLHFLVFVVFVLVLGPVIGLAIRAFLGKKIKEREKIFSIAFSLASLIFLSLILIYSDFYTEFLWFQGEGYEQIFWKRVITQGILFGLFAVATFLFFEFNLLLLKKFLAPVLKKKSARRTFGLAAHIFSGAIALVIGLISSNQWEMFLMFLNRVGSGMSDPIFQKDIAFYFFYLPVQDHLSNLLFSFSIILCLILGVSYFTVVRRKNLKFSFLGSMVLVWLPAAVVWKLILAPYHLLYKPNLIFYGADYTDIHVTLIAYQIFIVISAFGIAALIANGFFKNWKIPVSVLGALMITWMASGVAQWGYWGVAVEPNQFELEEKYIGYNIQCTRQAYGLDNIEEKEFNPIVSFPALAHNQETLQNIRLWDSRALLNSYHQWQALRRYYKFSGIDVDRYLINGAYRQVMLAPRELEKDELDQKSKTWVNEKLKFTHGYGAVLSLVNEFGAGGAPKFLVADFPPQSQVPEIKVTRPEIYFGLLTRDYVIVKTTEQEFDYPQGEINILTVYQGEGGIEIGSGLRKLALALKFNDKDILLSGHIKPESRIMFYRQIEERVRALAPFLKYDKDPYLVIDDGGNLWWMIDAYTVSSYYPYSEPYSSKPDSLKGINYIRNSVKVAVNAYNGRVRFYIFDENDPVIQVWAKTFPTLFLSKNEMPKDLLSHVRYPEDLILVQAKMYCNYHVTDPQVFYNKWDIWQFGNELYESQSKGAPQDMVPAETALGVASPEIKQELSPQEILPYHVIIRLPDSQKEEFLQMLPFTPKDKDNLIGWIAGRSDGIHYGKVLVFRFPMQVLVYGPMQFETRINQKTEIAEKFGLWSREGSRIIRGNTLIIPIENTLLYVEPIYIQATQSPMPEIKKIIVAVGERLEWGDTFDEALRKVAGWEMPLEVALSAQKHLAEYQRLMAEGKPKEAAIELEGLRNNLQRLKELMIGQAK